MAQFRDFCISNFRETVNVARERFRSFDTENNPCLRFIRNAVRRNDEPGTVEYHVISEETGASETGQVNLASSEICNITNYGATTSAMPQTTQQTMRDRQKSFQRNAISIANGSFDREIGTGEHGVGYKINEWQAAWNVTNAIQGMFMVSLPYAVSNGGYCAILSVIAVAYICCYTGRLVVDCLYETDVNTGEIKRVRDSYESIGCDCFGPKWGSTIVNSVQLIELVMTCILYIVVSGELMVGSFPEFTTRSYWMLFTGFLLLPIAFLKSLHHISMLSFWCTITHVIINTVIIGNCLLQIPEWDWSKVTFDINMKKFPISLGVIVFGFTSHVFLPTLEGNLTDRSKFSWMLNWSHIAAATFKAIFGYVCFLRYQEATQPVITNNLENQSLKYTVNLFLFVKALFSYPLPYYAACEILQKRPIVQKIRFNKYMIILFNVTVIFVTVILGIILPRFTSLMGLIGSFTGTLLSFIWPCYFHLKLKGNQLQKNTIIFEFFIIIVGTFCGSSGVFDSGWALMAPYNTTESG